MPLRPGARVLVLDDDRLQVRAPHGAAIEFRLPGRARAVAARLEAGEVDDALRPRLEDEGLLRPPGEASGFLEDGGPRLLPPRAGSVLLLGSAPLADAARRTLEGLGVPCRAVADAAEAAAGDVLLVLLRRWDLPLLDGVNARCLDAGTPWLLAGLLEPRRLHLGPLVVPGETACLRCYLDRRVANSLNREGTRRALEEGMEEAAFPGAADAVAAFAALEAARFLRGLAPATLGQVVSLGVDGWDAAHDRVLKAPRCPACSRLRAHPPREAWLLMPKEDFPSRPS